VKVLIFAIAFGYGGQLSGIHVGCCTYIGTLAVIAGRHTDNEQKLEMKHFKLTILIFGLLLFDKSVS
jgi:hypothetical protein